MMWLHPTEARNSERIGAIANLVDLTFISWFASIISSSQCPSLLKLCSDLRHHSVVLILFLQQSFATMSEKFSTGNYCLSVLKCRDFQLT